MTQSRPLLLIEIVVQLGVDIIILTALLSLSGGASNPFAILYLLPLTITAVLLPARVTWGISLLTVICYSLLLVVYIPMPHALHHNNAFNLHIVGMWIGFVLSSAVIAYFIVGLQKIIQQQSLALNRATEQALKSEQLVKLGVLAASAAHDMGTPLNTMALILEDIEYCDITGHADVKANVKLMRAQIDCCRQALRNMSQSTGNISLKSGGETPLSEYMHTLLNTWRTQHPQTLIEINQDQLPFIVMVDDVLNIALTNIIDNAIEASPDRIVIDVATRSDRWDLLIRDFGPGLSQEHHQSIGQRGFTTKQNGLGLGVFLSHSIIERLGGLVRLYNHADGGLCTHIQIPNEFRPVAA